MRCRGEAGGRGGGEGHEAQAALAEQERQRLLDHQLREAGRLEREARDAAMAAAAEALRQKTLDARPFNLSIAKKKRLSGEQRPCIGIASQIIVRARGDGKEYDDPCGCRLVPFDVSAMAEYFGYPLDQWPGLAAVAKLALLEKLPRGETEYTLKGDGPLGLELDPESSSPVKIGKIKKGSLAAEAELEVGWPVVAVNGNRCESYEYKEVVNLLSKIGVVTPIVVTVQRGGWKEVDPQLQSKLPGWDNNTRGARKAAEGAYGSKLVYWNELTGAVTIQHPLDSFYRFLVKVLLERNESPFQPSIMQFNVTDTPEMGGEERLESSFFFEYKDNRTLGYVDVVEGSDVSTLSTKGGIVKANNVISDAEVLHFVRELRPVVERMAGRVIWRAYAYWRSREKWVFAAPMARIRRNVLIRRLQLAVRRRWLRLDLVAWEGRRLRKMYWRLWWGQAIHSEHFAHSLHRVTARKAILTAEGGGHGLEIGDLGLDKEAAGYMDTMRATLARMEQLLAMETDGAFREDYEAPSALGGAGGGRRGAGMPVWGRRMWR